jgi:L-amino acid N-acyltransferase YncA
VEARVRTAGQGDFEVVAGIFAHYVETSVATFEETPPSAGDWTRKAREVAVAGLPFLVVEMDGAVAGFAYASPWRPKPAYRHTVEDTIYLAPDRTGRGLGRVLLGAVLAECTTAGVRQVVAVIAETGSDASAALHRHHGFAHAGRLAAVGRKHGRWIDTTLMQRDLAVAPLAAAPPATG